MSPPWMPFYVADYLRDTRRLTAAEHGAYVLLILEYWTSGELPDDDAQLARIASMTPGEWRKAKPTVQSFFHDGWHHDRINEEIAKAEAKHEKRSEAGKRGGNAKARLWQNLSNASGNASGNALASSSQPQPHSSLRSEKPTRASALAEPWVEADRDRFWEAFPNKVGKAAAMRALDKASRKTTPDVLFPALDRYINKTDDRAWCNPATWLNEERWTDQPATAPRSTGPPRTPSLQGFETLFAGEIPTNDERHHDTGFDLDLVPNRTD